MAETQTGSYVQGRHGGTACGSQTSADIGMNILKANGNAADAAAAMIFALMWLLQEVKSEN